MKKYIIGFLVGLSFIAGVAYATTVFNSSQVGSSPANGSVLQTNGSVSTWVATSSLGIPGTPYPFQGAGNSTSTETRFLGGMIAASSTFIGATTTIQGNLAAGNGVGVIFNPTGSVAAFAQVGNMNAVDFALAQTAAGHTHLNAPGTVSNGGIGFHLDGAATEYGTLDYTGWTFATSTRFTSGGIIVNGSSTVQYFNSASSSIGTLAIPSIQNAITLTNANGVFAAYTGTSCTNQFVRSLSALGSATCAPVSLTGDITGVLGIANGGTNAAAYSQMAPVAYDGTRLSATSSLTIKDLIATSTINFTALTSGELAVDSAGNVYKGSTTTAANPTASVGTSAVNGSATTYMRSDAAPAIDQTMTPTMTGLWRFITGGLETLASSTIQVLNTSSIKIPALSAGSVGIDSAGNVYSAATSTTKYYSFGSATTTWVGTTTAIALAPFPAAATINSIICTTDVGTVGVDWYYGPTPTHLLYIPTASTTANTITFTSSNTPGIAASSTVKFGTPVSSPTSVACTAKVAIPIPG